MFRRIMIIGLALSVLGPSSSAGAAADVTSKQPVAISLVTANGSGCPQGAGVFPKVPRGKARASTFAVYYRGFNAYGGSVRNCQLVLNVRAPKGKAYAIREVASGGVARLSGDATGRHVFTSYFSGESYTTVLRNEIKAPHDDTWMNSALVEPEKPNWSPCDRDRFLNINNTVRTTGNGTNRMGLRATVFTLRWANCL